MPEYNYVFVMLVYRNVDDLRDCLESIKNKVDNFKVIVVNAYFDSESEEKVRNIAASYDCDFLSVPNKGYSYGNNAGIRFAVSNYHFKYIVVCNPDTVVEKFTNEIPTGDIVAPNIVAASGKKQNPMYIRRNRLTDWLIYKSFKNNIKIFLFAGLGINKIIRSMKKISHRNRIEYPIYAAHGSFVLMSEKAVSLLNPGRGGVYDENIFLYAEEMVLAAKAKKLHLETIYDGNISIFHKEDGSMKMSDISLKGELAKGNIYYYEHYVLPKI